MRRAGSGAGCAGGALAAVLATIVLWHLMYTSSSPSAALAYVLALVASGLAATFLGAVGLVRGVAYAVRTGQLEAEWDHRGSRRLRPLPRRAAAAGPRPPAAEGGDGLVYGDYQPPAVEASIPAPVETQAAPDGAAATPTDMPTGNWTDPDAYAAPYPQRTYGQDELRTARHASAQAAQ